jgi:hypothetical protein
MTLYSSDPATKKVKYAASIIYVLVMAFIVAGSYLHQQNQTVESNEPVESVDVIPDASVY